MKNNTSLKFFIALIILFFSLIWAENHKLSIGGSSTPYQSTPDTMRSIDPPIMKPTIKKSTRLLVTRGNLLAFMRRVGKAEGSGSYEAVSNRGYLGLYQFHPNTLKSMGFDVSKEEFLSNPSLQDSAMIAYMRVNAKGLQKVIKEFNKTYYNGVYVTKAGILAGAHLVGMGGVLSYFYPEKYNYKTVDGNGVHVSNYMEKFAGYYLRGM